VLPGTIRSNWDNPSQLYNVIVAALSDGFRADILKSHRAFLNIASYKQSHTHAAANSGANDDNCGSD